MKLLLDLFPVIVFFAVYQLFGHLPAEVVTGLAQWPLMAAVGEDTTGAIYLATASAILASIVQVGITLARHRRVEKMHLISLALITVLGGATLLLRDATFIKWKPTAVNWAFAAVFLATQFLGEKTLVERMMGHALTVPTAIWRQINLAWVVFFLASGAANLVVAYSFSEETWVNFKLFGLLGLTFAFVIAQALYLGRFAELPAEEKP